MKRISDKKLAELGGRYPYSTISKKPTRIKKPPRSKSEFNRIYGSKARVEFVKSLPCAACGVEGYSQNAHVAPPSEKGTGYKAGFKWIVPLCGPHLHRLPYGWMHLEGCHAIHDRSRRLLKYDFPRFDPEKAAAECEQKWQEFLAALIKEK